MYCLCCCTCVAEVDDLFDCVGRSVSAVYWPRQLCLLQSIEKRTRKTWQLLSRAYTWTRDRYILPVISPHTMTRRNIIEFEFSAAICWFTRNTKLTPRNYGSFVDWVFDMFLSIQTYMLLQLTVMCYSGRRLCSYPQLWTNRITTCGTLKTFKETRKRLRTWTPYKLAKCK